MNEQLKFYSPPSTTTTPAVVTLLKLCYFYAIHMIMAFACSQIQSKNATNSIFLFSEHVLLTCSQSEALRKAESDPVFATATIIPLGNATGGKVEKSL